VIAVETGGNPGYAAGINRAMAYSGDTRALLVLIPDLMVPSRYMRAVGNRLGGVDTGEVVPIMRDSRGEIFHFI
jgi:GT2 family glycosyltransferase